MTLLDYRGIRRDFPIYEAHPNLVYLDNAATTHKPRIVIEAVSRFYREMNANVARGAYRLAFLATNAYMEAHRVIAGFIGGSPEELILVPNSSYAVNMLAYSLLASGLLKKGGNIVVSLAEHHSNMLPWARIAKIAGLELRLAPVDSEGRIDLHKLERLVDDDTVVVAVTHASNVTGFVTPVREVARIAHEHGAILVVDGAQSTPHMPIDVKRLDADAFFFSGHKMLGPMGSGGLWVRRELLERLEPPFPAGGTIEEVSVVGGELHVKWARLPWRMEPGTPSVADAIGLAEAVKYLQSVGLDRVKRHEEKLLEQLVEGLRNLPRIRLVSEETRDRLGIVAFEVEGVDPKTVAAMLSRREIAVRAGFHCAQPLHEALGFTRGTVRASIYLYNGPEDIEKLLDALREIVHG